MSDASSRYHDSCEPPRNWRRDELIARILRRWRALTGDKNTSDEQRRTLVACSAGADSVALAFALAQVSGSCVVAHIQHDIRPADETQLDADHVQNLATSWGLPFTTDRVAVRAVPGNLEANARQGRYERLAELADQHGCDFIATGHHADDQLETIMMHMMRGSGLRGMGGMRARSELSGLRLIRPLLETTHEELVALLDRAAVSWREDPTNSDRDLTRNRIRHELLPVLREFDPDIAVRASQWGGDLRAAQDFVIEHVDSLIDQGHRVSDRIAWDRDYLRSTPDIILGQLPLRFCERFCRHVGQDSITRRAIEGWVRSLKSGSADPSMHRIGPMVSHLDAHSVRMEPAEREDSESEAT